MTPSINRLAESAKIVGEYTIRVEFDLLKDEFNQANISTFEEFSEWVKTYHYYHGVVCSTWGQIELIESQLRQDFDELTS